jgi:LysM repeat protein
MTSNKFGRILIPVFVIAALVLSLFSAAPAMAQDQTTGPAADEQVPQEWLGDFAFDNGRVYYILAQGDTLQNVADRFGTTVEELRDANDDIVEDVEDEDVEYAIFAGQPILIPEDAVAFEDYDFDTMDTTADAEEQEGVLDPTFEADIDWDFETTDLEMLAAGEVYYIVETGDSLQGIANRFDTTVQELEQLNADWFEDQLYVGQPVQLPEDVFPLDGPVVGETPDAEATPVPQATAEPGIPATGVNFNVTPEDVDNRIFMFEAPRGSITDGHYIATSGDFLSNLAARMGVTLEELLDANPQIGNPNLIFRGEAIRIPGNVSDDFREDPLMPAPADADIGAFPVDRFPFLAQQSGEQPQVPATGSAFAPDFRVTPADVEGRNFMFLAPVGTITDGKYIVTNGDNMSNLAQRMHVSLVDLLNANPQIENPNVLFRGEAVNIPGDVAESFYEDPLAPAFGVDVGPVPLDRVPFTDQQ